MRISKFTLFVCTTILLSSWSTISQAADIKSRNNTGQSANDFHLAFVTSMITADLNSFLSDPWGIPTVTNINTLSWSGVDIPQDDIFTLKGYTLSKNKSNSIRRILSASWTYDGDVIGDADLYSDNNVITKDDLSKREWFLVDEPTAVPEPFTIIGTLIGGTAALRMRKKLKASAS